MRKEFVSDDEKEMVTGFVVFERLLEVFEDESLKLNLLA
jgi:hypothetical protein